MDEIEELKNKIQELENKLQEMQDKKKTFFSNKPLWIQVKGTQHQLLTIMSLIFKMEMQKWLKLKFMEPQRQSRGRESKFNYPYYQNFKIQLDEELLELVRELGLGENTESGLPSYKDLQNWRRENESS